MKIFKLENEPKIKPGFKIPEAYFETFAEKAIKKLPKKEPKVISFFKRRKGILMMAAAILIIALIIPIFYTSSITTKEIDESTLENYLSYQTSINQYDLINMLESEDIDNIKTTVAIKDETLEDILVSNNNLENLILDQ